MTTAPRASLLVATLCCGLWPGFAPPVRAQIIKCQDPQGGVSYSQGAACPPGSVPREPGRGTPGAPDAPQGRTPGDRRSEAVVDDALPAVDTGIPVITPLAGKFAWLDDRTLAVTTYSQPRAAIAWLVRRIVAYDLDTGLTRTLVERGFMDCTDTLHGLVSLELGDLESRFGPGSQARPAVQQFEIWRRDIRSLAPAPLELAAGWHPQACVKPAPEDLAVPDLASSPKPLRYLEPEHGILSWGPGADGHPLPPTLHAGRRSVALPLSINDISHDVHYLAWARAYQLSAGRYSHAVEPARDEPLVLMDLQARVSRHPWPVALEARLDEAGAGAAGEARMLAVREGALVVQPGTARRGGGLYLVRGNRSRRVWCTAAPAAGPSAQDAACNLSQPVQVSPDGCHLAFDAPAAPSGRQSGGEPTVHVMNLCSVAPPGRTRSGAAMSSGGASRPRSR